MNPVPPVLPELMRPTYKFEANLVVMEKQNKGPTRLNNPNGSYEMASFVCPRRWTVG